VPEDGTEEAQDLWRGADEVHTVTIAFVEATAAVSRRLTGRARRAALRALVARWQEVDAIAAGDDVVDEAAGIARRHGLRALDSLHLAAATLVPGPALVMATWDHELRAAAGAVGLATAPR
jgi:predicted nucleic acid-binding protein